DPNAPEIAALFRLQPKALRPNIAFRATPQWAILKDDGCLLSFRGRRANYARLRTTSHRVAVSTRHAKVQAPIRRGSSDGEYRLDRMVFQPRGSFYHLLSCSWCVGSNDRTFISS